VKLPAALAEAVPDGWGPIPNVAGRCPRCGTTVGGVWARSGRTVWLSLVPNPYWTDVAVRIAEVGRSKSQHKDRTAPALDRQLGDLRADGKHEPRAYCSRCPALIGFDRAELLDAVAAGTRKVSGSVLT
jgi:hypothetical protein